MAEKEPNRYPSNQAYINANSSSNRSSMLAKEQSSSSSMRASVLAGRVQDLEQQLVSIATALNEDGRENQVWQQQLVKEHREINQLLLKREQEVEALTKALRLSEEENQQLKGSLFKQNEEFEYLHRELQEARTHNSRVNSKQLEEKVLQLNDQISTLLVKIQQLLEENNQHISYIEELEKAVQDYKATQDHYKANQQHYKANQEHYKANQQHYKANQEHYKANQEQYEAEIQRLNDENNYLKDEIKEVESLAIAQQSETQDRYLQQLQQAKIHIEELKKSQVQLKQQDSRQTENPAKAALNAETSSLAKENAKIRAEVHTLEEELLQQREFQRAIKKKYEQRMVAAEGQTQKLAEEMSKLKAANRQLERLCSEHSFALEQLQAEKKNPQKQQLHLEEQFKNIILRLESEKEELTLQLTKAQIHNKYEHSNQFYSALLKQSQLKLERLRQQLQRVRQQLLACEQQLSRSRKSVRQFSQLAKRWEKDYRNLSIDYEQAFAARLRFEEKTKAEQVELLKHRERYEQLVRKCEQSQAQFRQLEERLRLYEQAKERPAPSLYDKESSDLVKLENSMLRQEVAQLRQALEQRSSQLLSKDSAFEQNYQRQLQDLRQREKELERLVQMLRSRLAAESTSSRQADVLKIRELNDQLTRVNKMLNQRESELDSFKARYSELQAYLSKRDELSTGSRHHPDYTRLKNQFVALQRKLMEADLSHNHAIQNANYELDSLRLENTHHRKKIEELLLQLANQRNTLDYGQLTRSLELSQLKTKELQKQLQFSNLRISELTHQLHLRHSRPSNPSPNIPPAQSHPHPTQSHFPYLHSQKEYRSNFKQGWDDGVNNKSRQVESGRKEEQSRQVLGGQLQKQSWAAYQQLVRWREEVRESRVSFSRKWGNEVQEQVYPLKEYVSS